MTRDPVRFTAPHPADCACVFCQAWRDKPSGPTPTGGPTCPRTPEDAQRIHTPEGGKPITTRED